MKISRWFLFCLAFFPGGLEAGSLREPPPGSILPEEPVYEETLPFVMRRLKEIGGTPVPRIQPVLLLPIKDPDRLIGPTGVGYSLLAMHRSAFLPRRGTSFNIPYWSETLQSLRYFSGEPIAEFTLQQMLSRLETDTWATVTAGRKDAGLLLTVELHTGSKVEKREVPVSKPAEVPGALARMILDYRGLTLTEAEQKSLAEPEPLPAEAVDRLGTLEALAWTAPPASGLEEWKEFVEKHSGSLYALHRYGEYALYSGNGPHLNHALKQAYRSGYMEHPVFQALQSRYLFSMEMVYEAMLVALDVIEKDAQMMTAQDAVSEYFERFGGLEGRVTFFRQYASRVPWRGHPHRVLADLLKDWAWEARGSGFADSVTEEGWKLFHERLQEAADHLTIAIELDPKNLSTIQQLMGGVALGLHLPREVMETLFEQGVEIDPGDYDIHSAMATYLAEKWHGEPGDMWAWVRPAVQRAPKGSLVPLVLWMCHREQGGLEQRRDGTTPKAYFDRPEVAQELEEMFKNLLANVGRESAVLNRLGLYYTFREDWRSALPILEEIKDRCDESLWDSRFIFDNALQKAREKGR